MVDRDYQALIRKWKPLAGTPTEEQVRTVLNREAEEDSWSGWTPADIADEIHGWLHDYPDLGFDGFWTAESTWTATAPKRRFKLLTIDEMDDYFAGEEQEPRRQPFLAPEMVSEIRATRAFLYGLPHPEGWTRDVVRASEIAAVINQYRRSGSVRLGAVILAALSKFFRVKRIPGSADCIVNLDQRFLDPLWFAAHRGGLG
jgi:hypothetical protein